MWLVDVHKMNSYLSEKNLVASVSTLSTHYKRHWKRGWSCVECPTHWWQPSQCQKHIKPYEAKSHLLCTFISYKANSPGMERFFSALKTACWCLPGFWGQRHKYHYCCHFISIRIYVGKTSFYIAFGSAMFKVAKEMWSLINTASLVPPPGIFKDHG